MYQVLKIFDDFFLLFVVTISKSQDSLQEKNFSFSQPKKYKIAGINVEGGTEDPLAVILRSRLVQGDEIKLPGDDISNAIKKLWSAGLFSDIQIYAEDFQDNFVFLKIVIVQNPKVVEFQFEGIRKSEKSDLKEKLAVLKTFVIS